jgi:hypothetical protein
MEQNLKPFDLQKALNGAKVVARDGREMLNIAYLPDAPDNQQVICVIRSKSGAKEVYHYYPGGNMWLDPNNKHASDLFIVPVEKEYWTVTYTGTVTKSIFSSGCLLDTEQLAKDWIKRNAAVEGQDPQIHKITRLE